MGYGMMGRPKEIVIRYSQKVPIPVREAIAHTTWGLFATEPLARAFGGGGGGGGFTPRGSGDRCRIRG